MKAMQNQQTGVQAAIDAALGAVKRDDTGTTTSSPFKINVSTPYFKTDDEKYGTRSAGNSGSEDDTTGSQRLSIWTPALLGGIGMAIAHGMRGGEPSANHIYAANPYEG